ncbi:hypothetical protein [Roseivirga echinicomitans]|uniref:Uncharacterized protein n=1 Tax=Roseivirga echinicomitans TaxID=296218 RepID=A0A150XEP6_9BACT|nr:hypothetical protein [Roseivirga echinicomitans]KYG77162.1 hypothetical protein AWN68_18185 [Roseivirga echinicomitans]
MNYTTQYDELLINQFDHLKRHPQLLPFIGAEWNESPHKALLIAESHYIPAKYNHQIGYSEWNDVEYLKSLNDGHIFNWTNTRANVEGVMEKWGHSIHTNIAQSIQNVFGYETKIKAYKEVSYYNYFQRPAEEERETIKYDLTSEDHKLAYEFYKYLVQILNPVLVIFLSKVAHDSYGKENGWTIEGNVKRVGHPTFRSWYRRAKIYEGRNSKEEFEKILSMEFKNFNV